MKKMNIYGKITFVILMITFWFESQAQAPGGVPYGEPKAVEFDLFNTILLIVVPVLLIIFYLWYRRRKKRK